MTFQKFKCIENESQRYLKLTVFAYN